MRKILITSFCLFLFTSGCAKDDFKNKKDVVAYVNKDPIYKSDLKRDVAMRAQLDPTFKFTPDAESDQLDVIIDRKLIVQYAMEKGLAREERFVSAIRTIWEHTLIRDFIDYKKKELQDYLFATDDDIKMYYDNMSYKATFKVYKAKSRNKRDEIYNKYLMDKDTSEWQAVGPLKYEELTSRVLLDAFDLGIGEAKRFEDEPTYYIVELSEKERVEIPALESLRPEIDKRVIALKEKRLFEDWLKERKEQSRIRINEDYFKQ